MTLGKILLSVVVASSFTLFTKTFAESLDDNGLDDWSAMSLSSDELEETRGRQDAALSIEDIQMVVQGNEGEQTGMLSDNQIEGAVTGTNTIASHALNGMSGIATIIQNTGNQVLIQDTTMVNVMIQP